MTRELYESLTHEQRLEYMYFADKVEIVATKKQLEDIGLDETYIGKVGYITNIGQNNEVTIVLEEETIKVYKDMIDEYRDMSFEDALAEAYAIGM